MALGFASAFYPIVQISETKFRSEEDVLVHFLPFALFAHRMDDRI